MKLLKSLNSFDDWMEKYENIIDMGKDVPLIDAKYKDENHFIKGCQSQGVAAFGDERRANLFYRR